METLKAGCILVDLETKAVALVYRKKQKDFSFPKGHLEDGETLEECAIRETAEETKRVAQIVGGISPYIERYSNPAGENCVCYLYIAIDCGKSDNDSTDTHDTYWIPFDQVEGKLSYDSLKRAWRQIKGDISKLFK